MNYSVKPTAVLVIAGERFHECLLFSRPQVDYRLGFQVENPAAMNQPKSNISNVGEVPTVVSGESATSYE